MPDLAAVLDLRPVALVTGTVLVVLSLFMTPPMVADLIIGHPDWLVFFFSAGATCFVGMVLVLANRGSQAGELSARQAFMLTTVVWVVTALFGAVPFALCELDMSIADAVFESMSGITTTGSTVITGLEHAPPGLLLWRAILQWLGGIGIIVMGIAILPMLNIGGMQLFRTESSDLSDKILPRAAQIASAIGMIYLCLTALCVLLYAMAGMRTFDAVAHAMTTIATGGYSTYDGSIGHFRSPAVEWIAIVFMVLGGIPFVLYIQAVRGNALPLWQDVQVRWFLAILLAGAAVLTVWLHIEGLATGHFAVRQALFTTISVVTGTGYATIDYGAWGSLAVGLLFFLMCVGGCTGSTTGGIKVFRFAIVYGVARVQISRLVQPSGVFRALYNGQPIADAMAVSVLAFLFFFALTFSILAVVLAAFGLDYLTAMSAALTALANVGPGLGPIIGPSGSFASLSDGVKWVLSLAMLLGRLELFTILVLFTPLYWRA